MKLFISSSLSGRRVAFTMAEILLSLTIIGVVAAITLPSLTGNINERAWNTQRKALLARMSQAISLMPSLRGYGTVQKVRDTSNKTGVSIYHGVYNSDDATEAFLSNGLSKVLKMNNICDSEHIVDCGMPDEITNMVGSKVKLSEMKDLLSFSPGFKAELTCGIVNFSINTKSAAFETQNGESLMVFYNPFCRELKLGSGPDITPAQCVCVNFIYDLNGKRGPNSLGKDVGYMSVLYPSSSIVVAPVFDTQTTKEGVYYNEANMACRNKGYHMPNIEELLSYTVNQTIAGSMDNKTLFSATRVMDFPMNSSFDSQKNYVWVIWGGTYKNGYLSATEMFQYRLNVRCVKRF